MVNYNGSLLPSAELSSNNRGFLFGDGVFETVRIHNGRLLFVEDHYFRLMSSMRIMRMEIPMNFTMEFFESEILDTVNSTGIANSARARITVFRNDGGFYLPSDNTVSYIITAQELAESAFQINAAAYEVDLFKDYYVSKQLLSSIKSTNRIINITGSIYASENGLQNCLLLNDSKNVIEALNGNLFMLTGNQLVTPPVSEGCLNGVMRKQIIALARKGAEIEVLEQPISPFDLQKADELFITNVVVGIQSVSQYRKKQFRTDFASAMVMKLNEQEGML